MGAGFSTFVDAIDVFLTNIEMKLENHVIGADPVRLPPSAEHQPPATTTTVKPEDVTDAVFVGAPGDLDSFDSLEDLVGTNIQSPEKKFNAITIQCDNPKTMKEIVNTLDSINAVQGATTVSYTLFLREF